MKKSQRQNSTTPPTVPSPRGPIERMIWGPGASQKSVSARTPRKQNTSRVTNPQTTRTKGSFKDLVWPAAEK